MDDPGPDNTVLGRSAVTSDRKVGVAAAPEDGPANTVLALCVWRVPVSVPLVVTGVPETAKTLLGKFRPTLVTVPPLCALASENAIRKMMHASARILITDLPQYSGVM